MSPENLAQDTWVRMGPEHWELWSSVLKEALSRGFTVEAAREMVLQRVKVKMGDSNLTAERLEEMFQKGKAKREERDKKKAIKNRISR